MGRKKKPDKMRVVSIKMEPSLIVALDRHARRIGGRRSTTIRTACWKYIEDKPRESRVAS